MCIPFLLLLFLLMLVLGRKCWGFNPRDCAPLLARASSISSFTVFICFARSMASASPLPILASSASFSTPGLVLATFIQPEDTAFSMAIASVYPSAFPPFTSSVFIASGMWISLKRLCIRLSLFMRRGVLGIRRWLQPGYYHNFATATIYGIVISTQVERASVV